MRSLARGLLHDPHKDASKTKATAWCKNHGHCDHETKDCYLEKERKGTQECNKNRECPRSDGRRRDCGGGKRNPITIRKKEKDKGRKEKKRKGKKGKCRCSSDPHPVPQTALNVAVHLMKECLATSQSKTKTLTKTSL